jgi:hypothetical protein
LRFLLQVNSSMELAAEHHMSAIQPRQRPRLKLTHVG